MTADSSVEALVALGSNLGDPVANVRLAMDRLAEISAGEFRRSSLWRSEPVARPPGSPPFINAAVSMRVGRGTTPEEFLSILKRLENEFGREPKKVLNEARPLDLDLIAFGRETRDDALLTLPHPRAVSRAFVLLPLAEVAPNFLLPGRRTTMGELRKRLGEGNGVWKMD